MEEIQTDEPGAQKYSRRRWLAMVTFLAASGAGYAGWQWLSNQPLDGGIRGGIPIPLREGLNANEQLFSRTFSPAKLVKEYSKSAAAKKVRANGKVGLEAAPDETTPWNLQVIRHNGQVLSLSLADIQRLPKMEIVFEFTCIEGWSQISWWGGVRLADFMQHYGLNREAAMPYVGMRTPDEAYYVGIDTESALHPQTILSYEMNGKPLLPKHGAPLRLIIPVKYGVKHLKQIGTIFFDNTKPPTTGPNEATTIIPVYNFIIATTFRTWQLK